MDVSDVLRDRAQEPGGLQRMVVLSLLAHAAFLAAVVVVPSTWLGSHPAPPKTVMTISLNGGAGGPANGGLTAIGGKAVQAETPPEVPKRREPERPPAAKTPEMTVPIPSKKPPARPAKTVTTPVKEAPEQARGRTPSHGAEIREGSSLAETGARGQGFGLSTGGGTGSGSTLDVGDFCCPDYLVLMVERVRTNWNSHAEVPGQTIIKYTIQRDGTITGAEIESKSGYAALDINALRAVVGTRQLLPLPAAFPNPSLTVHLNFQYTR